MFGITDLPTYLLGTLFIVLLPGPNSLYILSLATLRGLRPAFGGVAGVFVGDLVLIILSAIGMGALMAANPALFLAVKYAGAAYLAWIAVGLFREAWRRYRDHDALTGPAPTVVDGVHPFTKALVISLMNPKAILFYVSFFIQFVDPAYGHPGLTFTILGAILQVMSMIYLALLIFIGRRAAEKLRANRSLAAGVPGTLGALLLGFATKLATATLG